MTLLTILALTLSTATLNQQSDQTGWPAYGGDPGGTRYSSLVEINRENVHTLAEVWTYRTGELGQNADDGDEMTFEATPILVDGTLYLSTAFGKVIALDPATGVERWTFDPKVPRNTSYSEVTSRGVSAWINPNAASTIRCRISIFVATIDARIIALDGKTGAPCTFFGDEGTINLATAVGMQDEGDYQVTSPPAIINGMVVVGSTIGDNWNEDTGSGVVRAFDARTGELKWDWDPIPRDSTGWRAGAANVWSVISADAERDLVFVPSSSPSPDFYGGARPGDNRFANSITALRASTGEVIWSFQTVHHDLWDYDLAAQPVLVTINRAGVSIPAVVQPTKMGLLFVLNRDTGEPIYPVEERPVLPSNVPGETAWPTQPFPTIPRSFTPHHALTSADAFGVTESDRAQCAEWFDRYRSEGIFTPPSLEGTLMFPGNGSGINWGSVAFQPKRNLIVLNTSRLVTLVQLVARSDMTNVRREGGDYEYGRMNGSRYAMRRRTLLSPSGFPCNRPPWGTLAAVDISSGEVAWEIPFGTVPNDLNLPSELTDQLVGMPGSGGPIVTAGDLIFIAASRDKMLRAHDIETGAELWSTMLPRAGFATPMTYQVDGRQFVVIAAGGHGKASLELGDFVTAYALPRN